MTDKTKRYAVTCKENDSVGTQKQQFRKNAIAFRFKMFSSGSGMLHIQCSACFSNFDDGENLEFSRNYTNKSLG